MKRTNFAETIHFSMKHSVYLFIIIILLSACNGKRWRDGERLMNRGKAFMLNGQRDSAFVCFSLVADHYNDNLCDSDNRMVAFALNNCGYISLFFQSDYSRSYSYLVKAKDFCKCHNVSSAMPVVMQNLGNLYLAYGSQTGEEKNLAIAADYYRQSVDAAAKVHDWDIMLSSYINMTELCWRRNSDCDTPSLQVRLPMDSVPDSEVKHYVQLMNQSAECARKGKYLQAVQLLRKQLSTVSHLDNAEQYHYTTYFLMASQFRRQEQGDSAIACLSDALAVARKHRSIETQTNVYKELEKIYREKGKTDSATACHYKYLDCKDSLLYKSHLASVNEMHLGHEVELASKKIEEISTQRRIQTVIIVAVAVIAVVTLSLLYIIYKRNRTLRERNRTLYERNVELLKREEELRTSRTRRTTDEKTEQQSCDIMSNDDKQILLRQRIQAVLDDVPTITEGTFSLSKLAEKVGSNTTYVSHAVNDVYGKNLSMVLSELRIKEACRRINDPGKYGQYTLETISTSVGFKSRSTFLTAFKRVTGLLPSEYLKIAKAKNSQSEKRLDEGEA